MDIQVRTDYHVNGDEGLIGHVEREVSEGLEPFARRITGAQVHLSEESGARKGPPNLRCVIEVRAAGRAPLAVTSHAATKDAVTKADKPVKSRHRSKKAAVGDAAATE